MASGRGAESQPPWPTFSPGGVKATIASRRVCSHPFGISCDRLRAPCQRPQSLRHHEGLSRRDDSKRMSQGRSRGGSAADTILLYISPLYLNANILRNDPSVSNPQI
jgi:hypothetical protein